MALNLLEYMLGRVSSSCLGPASAVAPPQPSAALPSPLAVLLRVLPAIWYFLTFYYLAGFQTGAAYAAAYCFILITFSCVVGAMSMCITVVSNTAGQASFAMNFTLLFSLVFTGFLVNVNSIPGGSKAAKTIV